MERILMAEMGRKRFPGRVNSFSKTNEKVGMN